MLDTERIPQIATKEEKKADEYEALQSFLRSISSTATLPPYVKGETYSSVRGVFNQVSFCTPGQYPTITNAKICLIICLLLIHG